MVNYEIHYDWATVETRDTFDEAMELFSTAIQVKVEDPDLSEVFLYEVFVDTGAKEEIARGVRSIKNG